jgi:hypothetical protein
MFTKRKRDTIATTWGLDSPPLKMQKEIEIPFEHLNSILSNNLKNKNDNNSFSLNTKHVITLRQIYRLCNLCNEFYFKDIELSYPFVIKFVKCKSDQVKQVGNIIFNKSDIMIKNIIDHENQNIPASLNAIKTQVMINANANFLNFDQNVLRFECKSSFSLTKLLYLKEHDEIADIFIMYNSKHIYILIYLK